MVKGAIKSDVDSEKDDMVWDEVVKDRINLLWIIGITHLSFGYLLNP